MVYLVGEAPFVYVIIFIGVEYLSNTVSLFVALFGEHNSLGTPATSCFLIHDVELQRNISNINLIGQYSQLS